MYQPSTNVFLLISSFAALTQSTSIPQLQERAIIPFRAPTPPLPILPKSPGSPGGAVRPGGGILGGGSAGTAGSWSTIAAGARGTAPESTAPFLANTNEGNRELVERAVEAAGLVFGLLQNVVSLFGDDGDDGDDDDKNWRASKTTGLPQALKPTQVASTSDGATNATANYILSQDNETYIFLSDPRLMSKDVVAEMANANTSTPRLQPDRSLFTPSEYRMYLDDPICFYANIEGMYLEAFSSSKTGASASTTPTPTRSLQRRQSQADESSSTSCFVMGPNAICPDGPGSPEWTSSQAASVSSLWATELPDQLWSAHFATPATASDEVTATATSTTSCFGLNGREGPVTQYRELKFRETPGSGGAETTSTNEVTGGAGRIGGKCGFAYGLVGAAVAAFGLLVL
jgi:hypothetical protein